MHSTVNGTDVYLKIFESYLYWLESRGRSFNSARVTVISALTAAAFINALAVMILIQVAGGPRSVDWMADHLLIAWVAAVMFAVVHWWLSRRVRPLAAKGVKEGVQREISPTRRLWTSYMVVTLILWIVAIALAIVSMTP